MLFPYNENFEHSIRKFMLHTIKLLKILNSEVKKLKNSTKCKLGDKKCLKREQEYLLLLFFFKSHYTL